MKTYRSIPHSGKAPRGEECFVFVKYDGSNLRFEWSKKSGWYKQGTRKELFDESHPIFGGAIELFNETYADDLEKVFVDHNKFKHSQSVIVYTEWFGSESFAGGHFPNDPKQIVLFDVNPHKKGILKPKEFLDTFGHLQVAELIEKRILDDEFIEAVRNNEYECGSKFEIRNEVPEGVICKGGEGHNLWMCKIKTNDYREELKQRKGDDWTKYWE